MLKKPDSKPEELLDIILQNINIEKMNLNISYSLKNFLLENNEIISS